MPEFPAPEILIARLQTELLLHEVDIYHLWWPTRHCKLFNYCGRDELAYAAFLEKVGDSWQIKLNCNLQRESYQFYSYIAHELRHVKQFESGELKAVEGRDKFTWLGKEYKHSDFDYSELPYEIDANIFATKWAMRNFPPYAIYRKGRLT